MESEHEDKRPSVYLILHNVSKRHNIGNIVRSAAAFGVTEVCLPPIPMHLPTHALQKPNPTHSWSPKMMSLLLLRLKRQQSEQMLQHVTGLSHWDPPIQYLRQPWCYGLCSIPILPKAGAVLYLSQAGEG